MKKENTGASVQGSRGDRMVIHHPPRKVTKDSCQMCHWYCIDDHSCASKGLARTDKIDHWKKCEDFILDPDYLWFDVKKRIKEVRGQKFLKEMLEKSKSFIVDPDEYIKPKSSKEEPVEAKILEILLVEGHLG